MSCPTIEQLVQLALGDELPPARDHLQECRTCAEQFAAVTSSLNRVAAAQGWFDRGHEDARARLLAEVASTAIEAPRSRSRVRIANLKEVLTMKRILLGGAAAVAALLLLAIWGSPPQAACAQTVQALKDVKSFRCRLVEEGKKKGATDRETCVLYWAAPDSSRIDTLRDGKPDTIRIMRREKPGIEINHRAETYQRLEPVHAALSPLFLLGSLSRYSGQADRELPPRKLGDKKAPGFEIAFSKIDPDAGEGTLRAWADPETKLPLGVELEIGFGGRMILDNFAWNLPSDKWFDLEPPAKYKDETPNAVAVKEQTEHIVKGLKTFAKYNGGKYPQVKMVYGDVTSDALYKAAGFPGIHERLTAAQNRSPEYLECLQASTGFAWINTIQRHNPDSAYYGKTVGPEDKDKVLFRWKLEDGTYQVIYGDLHAETVSAEKLQKLEGR